MKNHRPQKNVRRGKGQNSSNKVALPKTRKDLRKEKRQQKKTNRFNYHNRSRKERQEYGTVKNRDKFDKDRSDDELDDFEDEEIESDFSDDQEEGNTQPTAKKSQYTTKIDAEREKEMMQLRRYEDSLKSNRIKQLEAANEEDDRVIQKYEKLLKINRRKNKEGIPKSFDDGLDYALELCTDENIRKMYDAAKEAAELEENSSDEFAEDLRQAVVGDVKHHPNEDHQAETHAKVKKMTQKEKIRVENLKRVEEKYFGMDELDDLDDLGAYDSEMEIELDENAEDDSSEDGDLYESNIEDGSSEEENGTRDTSKRVKFALPDKQSAGKMKRNASAIDSEEDEDNGDEESQYESSEDDEESEFDSSEEVDRSKRTTPKNSKHNQTNKGKGKRSSSESDDDGNKNAVGRFVLLQNKAAEQSKVVKQAKRKGSNTQPKIAASSEDDEENDSFDENDEFDDAFDDDSEMGESLDEADDDVNKPTGDDGSWEDIYGRKRDRAGNVIKEGDSRGDGGKYVPPHMRAKLEAEAAAKGAGADPKQQEKLLRLKRQLKGQINRLAESNVHRISINLDNTYMQNSRYDMNSTLTMLILEAIVAPTLTPERMVLEHILLVAILHANVGNEVGSHFLEMIVERFLTLAKEIQTMANESKQLDNCVQIICHLYTFDIVKCRIVHEVLQKLLECFNEKAVECILLVLRSIGFILRKDDPLALKDLIVAVQKKAANAPDALKNDVRVKFMLETLLAVKNNNMNKIPQYDPTLVEHFRKLLKGMITSGKYVSTLNIGLDDIINIPERGKWWLVGSAWHGTKDNSKPGAPGKTALNGSGDSYFSDQLLELARQQRMNTDDRRNVFCVVMSAEDYLDAFEKLLRLAIKDLRVVVSVIIHCSLAEKEYNPYYSVLAQKFCDYDRRYQLAIQFALWDRLKEIHSLQQQQVRNLARFITHVIAEGGLALSCLKVIEFGEIDKVNLRLMRQIMLGLLLLDDENKCLQVFSRISASSKLKSFKDGVRLFMHHFLARGSMAPSSQLPGDQVLLLQERIKQAEELLCTDTRIEYDV
ncbi:nucleolar MIF4G domain-containing protein 1 homolog [Anopheles nili]|uniref:nucleolar MIF4G domain-containing protein 1 homolog n=1 Tax=Anopheles nili TaxID=185578 RepID=UPI00237B0530|nr:nucleolar MIF4G domain-containing protein 1 homolog [Anopheles nili]